MVKKNNVSVKKVKNIPEAKPAAIVTGGAQGIGYAVSKALLESGYRVLIADINSSKMKAAVTSLSEIGEVHGFKTDVSNEVNVKNLTKTAKKLFSTLNLLVNNAAIANPVSGKLHELSLESWNKSLSVNLTGTFLCSKHSIPLLIESKGSIVNISSTRSLMSEPDTEAYAACKGGVDALTHAMAISYGPHMRYASDIAFQ